MIFFKLISIHIVLTILLFSKNDTWFKFEDEEKKLIGYKDKNGMVMIKPKYSSALVSRHQTKFDDILVVDGYYMLKSQKKFGQGRVYYTSEGMHSCESEGYIIFRGKNGLVGLFDKNTNIAIPAKYNYLSSVHSGLLYGKKGAKNVKVDSEHYNFDGGILYLLNTKNELLIKNFNSSLNIDYNSLKILKKPSSNKIRDNFLGINGRYYSFVNYAKEFSFWFRDFFIHQSKEKIISSLHDKILLGNNHNSINKNEFMIKYYKNFKYYQNISTKWKISKGDKYFIFDKDKKLDYIFDNCDNEIKEKYPIFNVSINYIIDEIKYLDIISFLRTDEGYKLFFIENQ